MRMANSIGFSFFSFVFILLVLGFYYYDSSEDDLFATKRLKMVKNQIIRRGVSDAKVLSAMQAVPRHIFVLPEMIDYAYEDEPLTIGYDQTISQPYIVALMTELLHLKGGEKILEIGTGSGYQAAVLARIAKEVYTIEIVEPLAQRAKNILEKIGYNNVYVRCGDGYFGWPEAAPFDGIIITAAPPSLPKPLIDQLKDNGRIVVPEGIYSQDLRVYVKKNGKLEMQSVIPVRFVPMTGYIDTTE